MSLTNQIYLPELSSDTITRMVQLFATHGITFDIDSVQNEIASPGWQNGFLSVRITVANKLGEETYDTGFELYKEPFKFDPKQMNLDPATTEASTFDRLKRCSVVLTTRSGTSIRGGLACSYCFAAALAEVGAGLWQEGESGEFFPESLADILESELAVDLLDIEPEPASKAKKKRPSKAAKLQKMTQEAGPSDVLSSYLPYEDMFIKLPIKDYLLRCISIEGSISSFQLHAFYLPLYSCSGFASNHWMAVGWDSKAGRILSWHSTDAAKLEEALKNHAEPYFSKVSNALEFAQFESSVRHKDSARDDEVIALSYLMGGDYFRARLMLELQNFQLSLTLIDPAKPNYEKEYDKEKKRRIEEVLSALRKSPESATKLLQQRALKMVKEMDLEELTKYFE